MFFRYLFVLLALAVAAGECLHLVSYVTACTKNDPNLNKCAKESASKALPFIVKGDKSLKIPPLNPLKLPLIDVHASDTLKIKLNNCILSGLENMIVKDIKIDLPNKHVVVQVFSNYINLQADYDMDGRILVLPISGKGPMNISIYDSTYTYELDYKLIDKKGEKYMELLDPKIEYDIKRSSYYFGNLFNGDQRLGDQMNKFLNENDKDVSKDLSPPASETINQIVTSILRSFTDAVPYNEIFP